jgi:hypothetical protein
MLELCDGSSLGLVSGFRFMSFASFRPKRRGARPADVSCCRMGELVS